jgi:putative ABC transport system permease protein
VVLKALLWRPLRRRPWRFLVTVVGVATGVAAVVATVAASRAAVRAFSEGVDEVAGAVRLELTRPGGVPASLLATLRPLAGDAVVVPVVEEVALLVELGDGVRVLGVDLLVDAQVRPALAGDRAAERIVEVLTGRGVFLSDALASRLDVKVGDTVTLLARARAEPVEVVALFPSWGLAAAWERVVVMDVALAAELYGRGGLVDRIELAPRAGVEAQALRERIAGLLPPDVTVAPPSRRREAAEQMVSSLRFNLFALSGISMLVGAVLVATTLATSVVQRRYTVALLRSLGASRRQIAGAVLLEAAAIGVAGGLLGTAGGLLGARAALASVRYSVVALLRSSLASEIVFEPWLAVLGLGLAVAVSLAAAVLPLEEALRTPPLQGLSDAPPRRLSLQSILLDVTALSGLAGGALWLASRPAWHGLPVAAMVACLAVMAMLLVGSAPLLDGLARAGAAPLRRLGGPSLRLAAAALAAGRRRAAWAAGAVSVAVALAVAIVTMVVSFRGTVERWTEAGMRADVWVRPLAMERGVPTGELDPAIVDLAVGLFGTGAVDPFYSIDISYRGRPVALAGAAFDVVARHGSVDFPGRESREVFAEAWATGGAVVNEPFANRFGVREGDVVTLEPPGGPLAVTVVGVFQDYSRSHGLIVVDRSRFLARFPGRGPLDMAIFLPDDANPLAARDRLLEAARGRFLIEAFGNRELKREVLAAFERTFAITTALSVVAAVVAVIAVVTVLLTLVGERRRELATVRALGASRRQIGAMMVGEASLLGLAATVAGVVAGLVIGVILVEVVNRQSFGWSLSLELPWADIAGLAAWVVIACVLAGLGPAAAALALQPAEVLREER